MCDHRKFIATGSPGVILTALLVLVASFFLEAAPVRTVLLNESVRLYAAGEYPHAIAEIDEVAALLKGTPMHDEAMLLRSQIVAFVQTLEKIHESVRIADAEGILRNVESALILDKVIAPRGGGFAKQARQFRGWAYYLRAARHERREEFGAADGWYRQCAAADPERIECRAWFSQKSKLVQKLYLKAQLYQNYQPQRSMQLYRDICRMTDLTDEMNQKAQQAMAYFDSQH